MKARLAFAAYSALLVASTMTDACSSDAEHPSGLGPTGESGTTGESGGLGASAGRMNGAKGGAITEAGSSDGGGRNSGLAGTELGEGGVSTGEPAYGAPVCSKAAGWKDATAVGGVSTTALEVLLSITPDELDLAFTRDGVPYVAHRADASAGFDGGTPVPVPAGYSAAYGAALSADGKRLVLVADPGQRKLGELSRTARELPFRDVIDERPFALVNQDSIYTGRLYASPVLSPDDEQLLFNSAFPAGPSTVVVAAGHTDGQWNRPAALTQILLDGEVSMRRLPSALSTDARTLFYFNEQTQGEEARFRNQASSSSALYESVDLGHRRGAMPNARCDRLYFSAKDDVVFETR